MTPSGSPAAMPAEVSRFLSLQHFGEVTSVQWVGGGCINDGRRLRTISGETFFLKTNAHAPAEMFAREAEGLEELYRADGPRIPRPFLYGADFLLLEDLAPASRRQGYWEAFGHQLARLHSVTKTHFGFSHDNYIGSTPQPNPWTEDGHTFFAESRLLFQVHLAVRRGLLERADADRVGRLAARLGGLVPDQPASLIHGDLWSGNAITDEKGNPAIIDPAAHYGWAEAELAMTALFGAFPGEFYRAYQDIRPLESGFWERFPIYNLYHLLNHLNLFGGGYLGQVTAILHRYAG